MKAKEPDSQRSRVRRPSLNLHVPRCPSTSRALVASTALLSLKRQPLFLHSLVLTSLGERQSVGPDEADSIRT